MLQTLQDNEDEWDSQIAERKILLVNEDIEAAKKQIESLEKQKKQLDISYEKYQEELRNLQDNIEILENSNQNEIEVSIGEDDEEETFFTILSDLENEEASLRGEIQSYNDLQRELGHNRNKYQQENIRMKKDLDFDLQKLEEEENKLRETVDNLNHMNLEYDSKSGHLRDLIESCETLKIEEKKLSDELQKTGRATLASLKAEEAQKKKELEDALQLEVKLKKKLARKQRMLQNEYESKTSMLNREQSIATWKNDRALLAGKLRKAKQHLVIEMQSLSTARKRREELALKCKKLFGESDPGDATGMRAKQIVMAEVRANGLSVEQEKSEERLVEESYNEELQRQKELMKKTLSIFRKHRDETIGSLQEELADCSQDGYIKLLKSEMNELISAISQI